MNRALSLASRFVPNLVAAAGPGLAEPIDTAQPQPQPRPIGPLSGLNVAPLRKASENILRQLHNNEKDLTAEILRIEAATKAEIARLTEACRVEVARLTEGRRQTQRGIVAHSAALRELAPDAGNFLS